MANYTVGDYLGQDSTEYLVYQILQKIQAVRELISGITHVDVTTSATIPTDPPAHPEDTLYFVLVGPGTTPGDLYKEYLWVVQSNSWEYVGTATVDLSDYALKTDIGNATLTIKLGDVTLGTFSANAKSDATITLDLSSYALKTDVGAGTLTVKQGDVTLGTFSANAKVDNIINIPVVDLSDYELKSDVGDGTLTIKVGSTVLGTFKANTKTDTTIEIDLSSYAQSADIGDATLTIKQGSTTLGTFKANAKTDAEILIPEVDLSSYALKADIGDGTLTIKVGETTLGTFKANAKNGSTITIPEPDLTGYALSTDIKDGTLTIKYGNTVLGTFSANSANSTTVTVPEPDLSDYALKSEIGNATLTIKVGETTIGTFTANAIVDKTMTIDLSAYAKSADIGDATLTIKQGATTLGTFKANAKSDSTITIDLSGYAQNTDIGDATLTITQGGTTLGTFNANAKTDNTIDIPAGATTEKWNDNDPVAHSKTTEAAMPQAITNGKIHVTVDTCNLYIDTGNSRIKIGDYIVLADDTARLNLQNPLEDKLYMVESTHSLWSYKNGWWSLLSFGDLLKRNVLVSTFPVAIGSNAPVEQGDDGNWTAHATMIQVPELIYLTGDMKFKLCVTQLPSSPEYDLYIAPAIYKYLGPDPEDGDKIKCSLVAAGNAKVITSIGWQEFTFNRGTEQYLDPLDTYFYVIMHNMNGLGMPGYSGSQMNDPPYVSWTQHNLGGLSDAPSTLELQSETTTRLFGSFYANGATQT